MRIPSFLAPPHALQDPGVDEDSWLSALSALSRPSSLRRGGASEQTVKNKRPVTACDANSTFCWTLFASFCRQFYVSTP